jgi:hypothetical protein
MTAANPSARFCALDWHSIDRTDKPQDDFLTMLPKHFGEMPPPEARAMMFKGMPEDKVAAFNALLQKMADCCPRSVSDGAGVLRGAIEQGLGWGTEGRPFILGIKSWSGGVGIRMRADATREAGTFKKNIGGAILMHPGCLDVSEIKDALAGLPAVLGWAKDDKKVPFSLSKAYMASSSDIKLIAFEQGGHHNFDGSSGLPNFDDDVVEWFSARSSSEGLISSDGQLRDDYVMGRVAANKPSATLDSE